MSLLIESSYYSRAVFIKLGTEDEEIHCLKEASKVEWLQTPGESIRRGTAMLATATDTKLEESDLFVDVEEDENELEENELVLEDC